MQMTDQQLDRKHMKEAAMPELEDALAKFVNDMEANHQPICPEAIRIHAMAIAVRMGIDVNDEGAAGLTDGWLTNFERRFEFKARATHDESGSVDIHDENVQESIAKTKEKIAQYHPSCVYNID